LKWLIIFCSFLVIGSLWLGCATRDDNGTDGMEEEPNAATEVERTEVGGEMPEMGRGQDGEHLFTSDYHDFTITESDLPPQLTDEIFGRYLTVDVFYGRGEIDSLTVEFSEPASSPYLGGFRPTSMTLINVYSDDDRKELPGIPLGAEEEFTVNETVFSTYQVGAPELFLDAPKTRILLDMEYDLEGHGTGKMQMEMWIDSASVYH
jgi:hypothetical protein